jgi:hypothetical protein
MRKEVYTFPTKTEIDGTPHVRKEALHLSSVVKLPVRSSP